MTRIKDRKVRRVVKLLRKQAQIQQELQSLTAQLTAGQMIQINQIIAKKEKQQ